MSLINTLLKRKGTGWRPDKPDDRDHIWQTSILKLREKVDLSIYCPPIWDQSGKNSCVAEAVVAAMMIASARNGYPITMPSRLFAYWNSRRAHRMHFVDKGTSIRVCAEKIRQVGICPEEAWPYTKPVNLKPNWLAYQFAVPYWNHRYYKIKEEGEARFNAIKSALNDGCPVIFGTMAPRAWVNGGADHMDPTPENYTKFLGGHAMLIVGYETTPMGYTWFKVRNSWGERWADDGYIFLGEEWISWKLTRDLTVIEGRG
jgi:hypothetical protein